MSWCLYLAAFLFLSTTLATGYALPPASQPSLPNRDILKTLRKAHPRLIALPADIERVRSMIKEHEQARQWHAALITKADKFLDGPLLEYKLLGPRLLRVSRDACDRMYTFGLLYRLNGDKRYADRAIKELLAISAFEDWHPSHFLDTAEMTHGAAIGYDWFYHQMNDAQRATVRKAIIEKGLNPAAEAYRGGQYKWWTTVHHNWNQVCNGGIGIGALAIADDEPQLATFILNSALQSLPLAMKEYAPDGGWAEGPGYWSYATRYTVFFLAAMDSALGTDYGISKTPGFEKAGDFRVGFVGPTDRSFNYADAQDRSEGTPEMFWLGRRFDKPLYAWHQRNHSRDDNPLDLLWFDPRGQSPDKAGLPLDHLFHGVDVAFFRTSWEDPDAIFVGFKGGDNKANHSHLDLGTFVLDALGQRWALDLGSDDYNMPDYWGKTRWNYYRLRTEGHNTLVVNGANQNTQAKAEIIAFDTKPNRAFAIADLSGAYTGSVDKALRGVSLLDRKCVLVQDEIVAKEPVKVLWTMHTKARIDVEKNIAVLTRGDAHLQARIVEPAGATFEVASAKRNPPENPNDSVSKLLIRIPVAAGTTRIAVLLTPYRQKVETIVPEIKPLPGWSRCR